MSVGSDQSTMELHGHHRDVTGGALRPAVFGAMDGLVTNFALITGVIGGHASNHTVVLTGLAGLAAGACSMAAGEYTSVASQSELVRAEIAKEKRELERHPAGEVRELAKTYQARGLEADLAAQVAQALSADPEIAWRVHVREELGVDPDDLPSPTVAAASSFVAFGVGALLPLVPYLAGAAGAAWVIVVALVCLAVSGGVVSRLTATNPLMGAGRQLLLGAAAAAITYGAGALVGGHVG